MKRYLIKCLCINKKNELEIDEKKFKDLKNANECLKDILSFEEKYELLLSNYYELEKECLIIASKYMINNNIEYEDMFQIKLLLNQRIVNLLTVARLYIDQITKHTKNYINEDVKLLFSHEYDNSFEYRFMEALRNYVQHRGLAVHSFLLGSNWTSMEEDGEMRFRIEIFTDKNIIDKDKSFKKQVFEEMPEKVNLLYSIRAYLESISKIHCDIRSKLRNCVDNSRKLIEDSIEEYKNKYNEKNKTLSVVTIDDEKILDKFQLSLLWDDIRIKLEKKNEKLVNLKKRFVSNSVK